jgi:RimJ/RimL family protein N-acetyltransferase
MDTPAETLTDGIVELRRWHGGQRDELTAAVAGSLEHLGAWLIWASNGYTADDAAEFLAGTEKRWENGEAYEYGVFAGGPLAGGLGVMNRDGGVEIGYWLGREHTGRGLMTRAVTLAVAEAFRRGAGYVEIKHDELNERSGAVPARLGFTLAGTESAALPLAPACGGTNRVWRLEPRS